MGRGRGGGGGPERGRRAPSTSGAMGVPVLLVALLWVVLLVVLATGCADSLEPEVPGRTVEAFVQDDPQSTFPDVRPTDGSVFLSPVEVPPPGRSVGSTGAGTFAGTAAGDFRVSLSVDGVDWVHLGSLNGITVQLQTSGDAASVHGAQSAPFRTYAHVRLSLRDVEITLEEGSTVGTLVLAEDRKVSLAAGREASFDRVVDPFPIDSRSGALIFFELNSEQWLTPTAVQRGSVDPEAVEAALTVRVRSVRTG